MLEILYRLLIGHLHKWEPFGDVINVFAIPYESLPRFKEQSFKCSHCGKIKIFKV